MIQIHAFQTLSLPFPCSAFFYMQVFHFRFIYNSSSLTHFTYFQSTSSILKPFFLLITFFSLTRTSLLFTNFTFFKNTGWNPRFFLFFFFPFLHFFLFIYALFLHTPSVISFINLFSCTISFHIEKNSLIMQINFGSLNINSFNKSTNKLAHFIFKHNIHVTFIQETHMIQTNNYHTSYTSTPFLPILTLITH